MTPSARLQAVAELLAEFESSLLALDILVGNYFRKRRYIGANDRRVIKDILYEIVRWQISLTWLLENAGAKPTPRNLLLAWLAQEDRLDEAFDGGQYGLSALKAVEKKLIESFEIKAMPDWARLNCPKWLEENFSDRFGKNLAEELTALNFRAPLTLRVNTLKTTFEKTAKVLKGRGFTKTKLSPIGLSSLDQYPLHTLPGFTDGHIEVQDEGSQVAARLVEAKPGYQVMDLCAGTGGKSLVLAATMQNKGQIFAYDINEKRLKILAKRVQKASVRNVQLIKKETLTNLSNRMDRVLIDVPCSGTGTWRRSPDLRIRLTPEKLKEYRKIQQSLLVEGMRYVKPGGWLIYVTCSLLQTENEDQITWFLQNHPYWTLVPIERKFDDNAAAIVGTLQLTPARHSTDGFFVCRLHKPTTFSN